MFSLARVSKFQSIWWCVPSSFLCRRILCSRGVEQLSAFLQLPEPPWKHDILHKVLLLQIFFSTSLTVETILRTVYLEKKNKKKKTQTHTHNIDTYSCIQRTPHFVSRLNSAVGGAANASAASSQMRSDIRLVSKLQREKTLLVNSEEKQSNKSIGWCFPQSFMQEVE